MNSTNKRSQGKVLNLHFDMCLSTGPVFRAAGRDSKPLGPADCSQQCQNSALYSSMSAVYPSPALAHPAMPPSRIALLMHGIFCFLIKSSNQPAARVPRPLEEPGAIPLSVLCSAKSVPIQKLTTIPDNQFDPGALTQTQYCGETMVQALSR